MFGRSLVSAAAGPAEIPDHAPHATSRPKTPARTHNAFIYFDFSSSASCFLRLDPLHPTVGHGLQTGARTDPRFSFPGIGTNVRTLGIAQPGTKCGQALCAQEYLNKHG